MAPGAAATLCRAAKGHNQASTLKTILGRILLYSFFGVGGVSRFCLVVGRAMPFTNCLGLVFGCQRRLGRVSGSVGTPNDTPNETPRHPTQTPNETPKHPTKHPTKHPDTRPSHPTKHPRRPTNNPNARPGHPTKRQLLRVVGSGFIEYWGPIEQEQSLEKAYIKYRNILTPTALLEANATKGEVVFQKSCGTCHKMYGNGGNIGPDLTGSNRANLDYFLFNVLNPSGEIQEDYKLVVITTRDGRTYSGNVIAENDRQVTMRIVGKESSKINKSDIQSREVMSSSLMPVGILETIQENEVLDLVKYMQTMKSKNLN